MQLFIVQLIHFLSLPLPHTHVSLEMLVDNVFLTLIFISEIQKIAQERIQVNLKGLIQLKRNLEYFGIFYSLNIPQWIYKYD